MYTSPHICCILISLGRLSPRVLLAQKTCHRAAGSPYCLHIMRRLKWKKFVYCVWQTWETNMLFWNLRENKLFCFLLKGPWNPSKDPTLKTTNQPGQVYSPRESPWVHTFSWHCSVWLELGHKTVIQLYSRQSPQRLCDLIESTAEQVNKTKTNYQQNQLPRLYFFIFLWSDCLLINVHYTLILCSCIVFCFFLLHYRSHTQNEEHH